MRDVYKRQELRYDGILQNVLVPCHYQIEQQKLYAHEKQYRQCDMPQSYLCVDLAKLDLKEESGEYKGVVMQVLQTIMDEDSSKGLYLWGKPGAGKSYLAAGMCNYFAKKKRSVSFVNVPKLISDLKMMFQEPLAMEAKLASIRHVDVLVLDDIGGESVTSWSRDDILLPILDGRMEGKKLTIFTSNYRMQELKEKWALGNGKPVSYTHLAIYMLFDFDRMKGYVKKAFHLFIPNSDIYLHEIDENVTVYLKSMALLILDVYKRQK